VPRVTNIIYSEKGRAGKGRNTDAGKWGSDAGKKARMSDDTPPDKECRERGGGGSPRLRKKNVTERAFPALGGKRSGRGRKTT